MPTLRPYQSKMDRDIAAGWAALYAQGAPNPVVLGVSPTGSGKTVTFSKVILDEPRPSCAIAHRKEIVAQISLALARNGVRHRIIGSDATRKSCQRKHLKALGRHFLDPNSRCAVASVDTLLTDKCKRDNAAWFPQVALWVGDEGHHFLRENKWGRAVALFANARGLLVTAETERADGKGLGRGVLSPSGAWSNDGIADLMVEGPMMRECIEMGYLVPYRVITVKSDVDIASVEISKATGDFNLSQLRDAFHRTNAHCGTVVKAYRTYALGLQTIVFSVDVETASQTAAEFRADGIAAEVVSSDTPDEIRGPLLDRFEAKQIQVLVNVDLFGEGFDLPNIEAVIMDRHTESFNLYKQQWGRGGRLDITSEQMACWDQYSDAERRYFISISAKPHMVLIDLVGNFIRHNGPPDRPSRRQSLDRRGVRSQQTDDAIKYRHCNNPDANGTGIPCAQPYERFYKCCPYCQFYPVPAERSAPELVDGDLLELDAATLAAFEAEKERIDGPPAAQGHDVVALSICKRHYERQAMQEQLRLAMAWWAGFEDARGRLDRNEQYRRFFFAFGTDAATALTLGAREADELRLKITKKLAAEGIDATVSIA